MIYIIRHGQTQMNQKKVLQGRSNHPLNEEGIRQAEEAGRFLRERGIAFDHVFSSPLIRAVQTAELVTGTREVTTDERLIEMDYGPYEGTDLQNPAPEILHFFRDFVHNPAPEGMEQLSHVIARAGSFLEELRGMEGNILISTHAIAMKGLLEYLTPESGGSYWSRYIGNCAIYVAETKGTGIAVPYEITRLPEKPGE